MNRIIAHRLKIIAPMKTSNGNLMSNDFSKIMGINNIAPAGGKNILNLSSAKNKIVQAIAVQIKSGKPKISFKNNLKEHPIKEAKVIIPTI